MLSVITCNWIHPNPYSLFIDLLAEKVAKFINRVCSEKGLWCRLPLNANADSPEMDEIVPSIGVLFGLPDVAIVTMLKAIGFYKINRDEQSCIDMNGVESFYCKNMFNNTNFEISKSRLDEKDHTMLD